MINNYCIDICFVMIGLNLIIIYSKLRAMDRLYESWRAHTLQHDKVFTDIEWHRADDLGKLADTNQRIQELEEKIKALEDTVEYLENKL